MSSLPDQQMASTDGWRVARWRRKPGSKVVVALWTRRDVTRAVAALAGTVALSLVNCDNAVTDVLDLLDW